MGTPGVPRGTFQSAITAALLSPRDGIPGTLAKPVPCSTWNTRWKDRARAPAFHVEHPERRSVPRPPLSRRAVPRGTTPIQDADPKLTQILARGLTELGVTDPSQREALIRGGVTLAGLTARWAERMNLTGHRGPEQVLERLLLESLALGSVLEEPRRLLDLGSGAGFPGLPLALLWPRAQVTLMEPRERRHFFQRAAVRALGLANVTCLRARAEAHPPEPHDLVIAQALAEPATALALMRPWVEQGGLLAIPAGADPPRVEPPEGIEALPTRRYSLPAGGGSRSVWLGRRIR